jgi:hypothetical protein
MTEPTLNKIDDYNSLAGEKRRIVWAVIVAGLVLGTIFAAAKTYYGSVDDEIVTTEKIGKVPVK